MPDLINRYISTILTIDQVETITNKTIDGDFNTISDIADSALKKITNKAKLHDNIVYNDDATTQQLPDHSDILFSGLLDGDILRYNATSGKWVNDNLVESGTAGDITGASNVGSTGTGIFFQESTGMLQFSKLKSNTSSLTIAAVSNLIEFTVLDATTSVKGLVELATDGEVGSSLAVTASDSRLTNSRTPSLHATSHKSGQTDVIKLDELGAPTDITTLNASTSTHGLLKKLSNVASEYLDGTGNFSTPSSSIVSNYLVKNVNELQVINSTVNTNFLQYAFAADEMGTNKIFEVVLEGFYSQDSGADKDLIVTITFGATVLIGKTIDIPASSNAQGRVFRMNARFFNKGVTNAQRFTGFMEMGNVGSGGTGLGDGADDEMPQSSGLSGTSAENTTLSKIFKIELQHSSSTLTTQFTRVLSYIREIK